MNLKPTHWLVLATAVASCAVACGLYLLRQEDAPQAAGLQAAPERRSVEARGASLMPRRDPGTAARRQQPAAAGRAKESSAAHREHEPRQIFGSPPSDGQGVIAESQWRARAAKVEQEANHELRRLVELLDLDAAQQDQLFAMLARRSSAWMPGMQTSREPQEGGGELADGSGSAAADDVMAYLNLDQQQTLVQEEMDRQAWWEEVLPQLLPPQLQDGTTGGTDGTPPAVTDPAPDTKPFEGGELLEE